MSDWKNIESATRHYSNYDTRADIKTATWSLVCKSTDDTIRTCVYRAMPDIDHKWVDDPFEEIK